MSTDGILWLDARGVARLLGVSPRTVLRLARSGRIPYLRLGYRTVRFAAEDVAAALRNLGDRVAHAPAPRRRGRPRNPAR